MKTARSNILLLLSIMSLFFCSCSVDSDSDGSDKGSFRDPRDGRVYKTVQIGSQTWMAENLNYRTTTGSWYYNDDSTTYSNQYGRLYNWNAALSVAPSGWHLPSSTEWQALLGHLGGNGTPAYNQMIYGGASGFEALLGGTRDLNGNFNYIGSDAYFWSSTQYNTDKAWRCYLMKDRQSADLFEGYINGGHSVRCIKD